jgi:outer membrane protein TolC
LQAANALPADDDDSSPILMQIEQADQVVSVREAMYQKALHTALQDVESAMGAWHSAGTEQKMAEDALELRTADVRDTQRAMAAGRASRVELLKAELNENQARENLLVTTHARYLAFAAVQLALGRE